jgi:hypothetical protein
MSKNVINNLEQFPPLTGITDDGNEAGVTGINNDKFNGSASGGVVGISNVHGVHGISRPTTLSPPTSGTGVFGESDKGVGVYGSSSINIGVRGESAHNDGVTGVAHVSNKSGVFGSNDADGVGVAGFSQSGIGVVGQGGSLAGKFVGDVEVTGNLNLSSPTSDILLGDVAEDFCTQDGEIIEPGTVVVLNQHGMLRPGDEAYDKKVAGVVSGAGDYRPAIILDKQRSQANRLPVALTGKVCCKVDAQYSPIEVGDMLTTSPTPGHAMKAADPLKAFGAVIGKALRPLPAGQGLIPILIALQ